MFTSKKFWVLIPENQKDITFKFTGRFGPYLKCENKSARIENVEEIIFNWIE